MRPPPDPRGIAVRRSHHPRPSCAPAGVEHVACMVKRHDLSVAVLVIPDRSQHDGAAGGLRCTGSTGVLSSSAQRKKKSFLKEVSARPGGRSALSVSSQRCYGHCCL